MTTKETITVEIPKFASLDAACNQALEVGARLVNRKDFESEEIVWTIEHKRTEWVQGDYRNDNRWIYTFELVITKS